MDSKFEKNTVGGPGSAEADDWAFFLLACLVQLSSCCCSVLFHVYHKGSCFTMLSLSHGVKPQKL